ncbi:hypothetical protein RCO28_07435 [Streptomyces sp. LHD-70]|uniref:hypothetical protein n=1 Tax=Streptomyces sp. LHD-70 TaxID=3072140 RepID=UPI00280DEBC2|nr:hypothetical protein [Streptomyces sp. LHD-70]MDQ8702326.1 hypothetical protein [Streptomyces sp. LHD-70]
MSLQDDLKAAQRSLDELGRSVDSLERQVGDTLDVRRVRADTDHLRASLAQLREAAPGQGPGARPEVIRIPDKPYDSSLWSDVDDEGLGAKDRHAP